MFNGFLARKIKLRGIDMRTAPKGSPTVALQGKSPLWILPAFAWLFLLIAVPLAFVFILSLARRSPASGIDWVWVSQLRSNVDPLYLWIYWRSLLWPWRPRLSASFSISSCPFHRSTAIGCAEKLALVPCDTAFLDQFSDSPYWFCSYAGGHPQQRLLALRCSTTAAPAL